MISSGQEVNKEDQVSKFVDTVKTAVEASIVWHSASAVPANFPSSILDTKSVAGPTVGNINDLTITANTLAYLFRDYAKAYCKYRKIRYRRFYNTNGVNRANIDQTNVAAVKSKPSTSYYVSNMPEIRTTSQDGDFNSSSDIYDVEPEFEIKAENFNQFVNDLKTEWDEACNDVVDLRYYYCHSSCHSSCHSNCHCAGRMRR